MSIARASIQHKVATILASILICVFGLMFATQLQMALMPEMEMPMAVVACYYTGASPSDIEELVTRPLESAIMSVSGVDGVSSTSSDGVSQLQITYVDGTDLDIAATKLREQFDQASLPDDAMDPVIINMNLSALMPTAMIALVGEDLSQLQTLAEDLVVPALERINGVAQVTVNGGVEQQIAVELDPTRTAGYGLSASYVSQFLAGQNLIYPGGSLENGSKKLTVSTDAKFQTVDDVRNMILSLPTGGTVRLGEVANVTLEDKDMDAMAKSGESACVVLQVSKQSAANEVYVSEQVVKRLDSLKADNPSLRYSAPYLASDYINQTVDAAYQNILQGVLLAAVVVLLFLRRGGATLTIAVSMPICILTVFVLMRAFNLTLNMMSLGGIAMGVGMIVDNSIVVLENIYRYSAEGRSRMESCVEGAKEVFTSLTASTLTTIAVFLPLGLTGGMAGMLFDDFCLTISFLILGSLVIAITLVPLLCYFLLDEKKVHQHALKKAEKKAQLCEYMKEKSGTGLDPDSIFDIQVKRLHEYKRQQMNALYVIHKYLEIKAGKTPLRPVTVIFGAKAAPAYVMAKHIIHLILCLRRLIENDPQVRPWLHVAMVENYNVTWAERLIPACDISEQISLASKEASGTGNMKFMANGAVTLGTLDGANVEIAELVGPDNIYTFGAGSNYVIELYDQKMKDASKGYQSQVYYERPAVKPLVDFLISPTLLELGDEAALKALWTDLTTKDWFMALLDVEAYTAARDRAIADYGDRTAWARKMLVNTARSGYFSSDRTIAEYNRDIWRLG